MSISSGNGLVPVTWTNADPVHLRKYAALGGDEFIYTLSEIQSYGLKESRNNYVEMDVKWLQIEHDARPSVRILWINTWQYRILLYALYHTTIW